MQQQLLHAPVQQFPHVDFIFRWARDFVDPSKLLHLPAGPAEHAQNFAVQADLVNAARESVRRVNHLIRSGRDANGPRRAGTHGSHQIDGRLVANDRHRVCVIEWFDDLDIAQVFAIAIEHFNASVAAIRNVNISLRIGGNAVRSVELAGSAAGLAK